MRSLIELTARREAERRWRRHGARTLAEAVSALTADVRRHIGIVAVREMARHRLRRVQWVGVPRSAVEARPRRGQIGAAVGGVVGAGPRYHAQPEEEAFYAHLPRGGCHSPIFVDETQDSIGVLGLTTEPGTRRAYRT